MADGPKKISKLIQNAAEKTRTIWIESKLPDKIAKLQLRDRLVKILPSDLARTLPNSFDPAAIAEWTGKAFQKRGLGFYGKILTILLCTYFLADLTSLLVGKFIPEPPPVRVSRLGGPGMSRPKTIEEYAVIHARNLFNSRGLIPGEEVPGQDLGGAPIKSSLPLNLIGTIILQDDKLSVATVEDKTASQVFPLRPEDEIPGKMKVVKVEPYRVIFVNTASGRREYLELPQDLAVSNPQITLSPRGGVGAGGIERLSPTQFNVSRQEVDKALGNLNQVLTQARCVPNFENGMPSGYKCFQIVPGSIYDKLGMQDGDVICGLNGQNIDNPGKAFEMFNELKNSNHLELCLKRDGKVQNYAYDIR